MNIIPTIPFNEKFNHNVILATSLQMIENFNNERDEVLEKLDIVLSSSSPFFIQRILQDDPTHIKDPKNIQGRLSVAKIQVEQELSGYYWAHLCSITSDYFYPALISNFNTRYFFMKQESWGGVTYIDFNLDNVQEFLSKCVFKPFSKEIASGIVSCGNPYIEKNSDDIVIKPFTAHCSALNRFITAAEVVAAILFLKHGDDDNWLEFSRTTTFALNDINKKHDLFHLIKPRNAEFAMGAHLDISFDSILNVEAKTI